MSWQIILKIDYPFTENLTWNGQEYSYQDEEMTMATPNGVLYLYKDLRGNIIKLYLSGDEIKEWTDDDQKEFEMETQDQMFNVKGKYNKER